MPRSRRDRGGGARMESLYNSVEFRMYCFKVLACSKHYCHDWTECPFAHPGEKARRRDPRLFRYVGIECPQVKVGGKCPRGDLCPFAHNVFECWLHPTRYRTQLCNEPASCRRKVCFFAHSVEELREPTAGLEQLLEAGGAFGTPMPAPRPAEQRASVDERQLSGDSQMASSPAWSTPDTQRTQQRSPQEEALLAAAIMQLQSGQPMGSSPELTDPLEQLALLQAAGGAAGHSPPQAGGTAAGNNSNERVAKLLLLLLKEIAQARQTQGQQQMTDAAALAPQAQSSSLDGVPHAYCPPSTQPRHHHQRHLPRMSLETLRQMSFNMLSSMGKGGSVEGTYARSPSLGRVSLDGSIPDFVLHDTRARAPSIDSNMSETLNMARAGRMSMESSSSLLSGDCRSIELGAEVGLLRFAGLAGDPTGTVADALAHRYEPRASVDSCLSDGYLYRTANPGLHVQANGFPADV